MVAKRPKAYVCGYYEPVAAPTHRDNSNSISGLLRVFIREAQHSPLLLEVIIDHSPTD